MPEQHSSVTHRFHGGGAVLCAPPPSTQLASRSDISKLDFTEQKVDNLRNRWAYIAVFGLISKWKSQAQWLLRLSMGR